MLRIHAILFLMSFSAMLTFAEAQNLSLQINSGSNSISNSGIVYSGTFGKAFATGSSAVNENSPTLIGPEQYFQNKQSTQNQSQFKIDIRIFPNPAADYIRVLCGMRQFDIHVKLINMNGQIILHEIIPANTSNTLISLPNQIESGQYLVNLTSANAEFHDSIKLIVTK